jgi:putative peptidoglycan lipid II flippase
MTAIAPRRGSTLSLIGLNLGGKFLAIGKTLFVAALFGTTGALDAFWVAYSLPLMLPGVLASVVTLAFVPRFVKNLEGRTGPDIWRGANSLFTVVVLLAMIGGAAMYVWASELVHTLAPGLEPATHDQAVSMTRMMVPAMVILVMSSLLGALSYARSRFTAPGLEGVVNNVATIAIALLFARQIGVRALIIGVNVGFAAHFAILCFANRDLIRSSLRPALALTHPDLVRPLWHMFPLLVGAVGGMLTGLVDQYFVSKLDTGSISALSYARMLSMLPVEVFTAAIMSTYYPALGRGFAAGDYAAAAETYAHGSRFLSFLTLPSALLLAVLAKPIVIILLEHGTFDARSTELTVEAMAILAVVVVFRSHAYFSYRVLHSAIRPWTQVVIGLLGVATCVGLNILWAERLGLRGIALSAVLSQLQSAILAAIAARRVLGVPMSAQHRKNSYYLILVVAVLGAVTVLGQSLIPERLYEKSHYLWAIAAIACVIPAGIAALALAWKLRVPEIFELWAMIEKLLGRRRARADALIPVTNAAADNLEESR